MLGGRSGLRIRRWSVLATIAGILSTLLLATPVAAVDPGDDSSTAIPIAAVGVGQDYDTTSATADPSDPDTCDSPFSGLFEGPFSNTFWHTFTPDADGELIVDVNSFPDPTADGFLAILFVLADDGLDGLDLVACSAFPATVEITAEAGRTYYAMTASLPEAGRGGPAVITVVEPFVSGLTVDGRAAFDPQTRAVTITGTVECDATGNLDIFVNGRQAIGTHTVFGFGDSAGGQPCDGLTDWTVTIVGETGPFNPGTLDVTVDVFACSGAGVCSGDFVEATVKARSTSNKPAPAPPPPPAPANDALADAIALEVGGPALETDTTDATVDLGTDPQVCPFSGFPPSQHTVWYTITTSVDGWVEVVTTGSSYDTTLYVLGGGAVIACNDDANGTRQSRVTFEATAGVAYPVMTGTYDDSPGGHLVIAAAPVDPPPPPPANDERDGATAIALGDTVDQDTVGATGNATDPNECPEQFGVDTRATVWYAFTAADDGFVEVNTFGSDYATYLFILDGSSVVACSATAEGSDQSQVIFEATAGTTYDVMIGSFQDGSGLLELTVIASEAPPPPPEPIELQLTLDPTAPLDTRSGEVTLSGTITCSRSASGEIFASLFQEGGRFDAITDAFGEVSCDDQASAWSITFTPRTTKFLGGDASAFIDVGVATEDGVVAGQVIEETVRLRPTRSVH